MLFFLGLLAFIQVSFLPGILLLKAFDLRKGWLQTIVLAFGLSLITNHLIVFLITALKLPIQVSYYLIFGIEILALVWGYRKTWSKRIVEAAGNIQKQISTTFQSLKPAQSDANPLAALGRNLVGVIFLILALTSIWWALKVWLTNFDTVFTQWDAIQSWNDWATDWYYGVFPEQTWRYPQLIPTNFAVTYAFLGGTQIQFFAKGFMPLFNIFILLMLLDLALDTQNFGYLIGVTTTRYIMKKFLGDLISSGYVDVALAFFAFLPIYVLLKAQNKTTPQQKIHYLWVGGILSAGTALTKQNGLLIFGVYPVLSYLLITRKLENFHFRDQVNLIAKIGFVSLLVLLPWYLMNEYHILAGLNESNVEYLMGDRHDGRDLTERFVRAAGLLEEYVWLYPFVIVMLPFLGVTVQWIAAAIFIPYSLIWALAFSTFARNLSIALPYLGMLTGLSLAKISAWSFSQIEKWNFSRIKTGWIVILVAIAGFSTLLIPNQPLIDHQTAQQKEILINGVNKKIYAYFDQSGAITPIMTNYPIRYLPGLEDQQIEIGNFSDYEQYRWTIDQHPESHLMLVFEGRASDEVLADIDQKLNSGEYERIFKEGNYVFIRIQR